MNEASKPGNDMETIATVYAVVWRWLLMSVSRYGSLPSGELLIVVTLIVMDRAGYHPTVTELSDITGMPKSSISRYVSDQMSDGFLEEYIDAKDRRRRRLRPTEAARQEMRDIWFAEIPDAFDPALRDGVNPMLSPDASVDEVMEYLKASSAKSLPRVNKKPG